MRGLRARRQGYLGNVWVHWMVDSELKIVIPLEKSKVFTLRQTLRSLLCRHNIPEDVADDIVLSTQEACNNAIVHSHAPEGVVEITAYLDDGRVSIEVRDRGCGFDASAICVDDQPDTRRASGRGLFLIYHLMDDVEVCSSATGTVVRMSKFTAAY